MATPVQTKTALSKAAPPKAAPSKAAQAKTAQPKAKRSHAATSALDASVSAVRTTGIYCQSSCTAKPNFENTSRFSSPAAAETAGYRACLRCRPERRPGSWLSPTGSQPVEAALALLTDGYLDSHTEDELASQVGYSARQLRRLFDEHIGATPDYLARSRRAHFARRLIDDTDLSFYSIAAAAGFGSQRQFQRVITDVFKFSPTQLRSKQRPNKGGKQGEPGSAAGGGLRLLVPYVRPYNFSQVLDHLRPRATVGVEVVTADTYRRSISVCGEPGIAEVADAGDGQHLALTLHLSSFHCVIDDVQRCRTLFATDEDPQPAQRHLSSDPVLNKLIKRRSGLRVPRSWDRFETVVRIIVGQQISVKGASTITGRIAAAAGDSFSGSSAISAGLSGTGSPVGDASAPGLPAGNSSAVEKITHIFPSADAVANHSLAGLGLTQRRIDTLRAVSAAIASGELDLLSVASLAEVVAQWSALPGIGPWTAQLIAMRVLRRDDAWPPGDLGLLKGLGLTGASKHSAAKHGDKHSDKSTAATRTKAQIAKARTTEARTTEAQITEAWRPYRSWAAQHIWSAPAT